MIEIKKLLYATYLNEPVYALVERLLEIRKLGLKEFVLVSASPSEELRKRLSEDGVDLKVVEGSGTLASNIIQEADKENPSLVVAHLNRERKRLLKGSTIRDLIKNTPFPLLLIPENGKEGGSSTRGLFESLLLATDWSDAARKALLYVIGLKDLIGVLDIVYVLTGKLTVRDIRQLKERVEEIRSMCLEEEIDAESHFYAGKTAGEILLASRDYNATLIVMGYESNGILRGIFRGSTCYRVAEESTVPVLIIP